jgi:hypothetical protein
MFARKAAVLIELQVASMALTRKEIVPVSGFVMEASGPVHWVPRPVRINQNPAPLVATVQTRGTYVKKAFVLIERLVAPMALMPRATTPADGFVKVGTGAVICMARHAEKPREFVLLKRNLKPK